MDWRLKAMIRRSLLRFPEGDRAYRWLTTAVLGTNAGMAYKWFRVIPAHIRVMQEIFGPDVRAQRLWCYDSGATMAAGLAIAIASDVPGLLTDRRGRLHDRYCAVSRRVLREKGEDVARLSGASQDKVSSLLQATQGLLAVNALATAGITYADTHARATEAVWRQQIGCVFSAGTLEHYTPEALEYEVAGMALALKPGGVMSHVVDHRDHLWHADKSISPLAHLTLDEVTYQRRFANPLDYHNRWLRSRYVELFTRHGFQVSCRDHIEYTPDLPPLVHEDLSEPFQQVGDDDLRHLVTHFVAVKE